MRKSSLLVLAGLALCSSTAARQNVRAMKVPGPVRSAGVYHVATGTWTRAGDTANISATKVYSADTPSGYFGVGWETSEGVDEGILPGTANPEFGGNGTADAYLIDGFSFGYCTQEVAAVGFKVRLYDSYTTCDNPNAPTSCINEAGQVDIAGAPGGAINACWLVTVDLAVGGEICMEADGGVCFPGAQGAASGFDNFGWGLDMDAATYTGVFTGPLLDGYDPLWASPGEGTCYNPGAGCGGSGLNEGAGSRDLFGIGAPLSGCFFFGGYNNPKGCGGPANTPPGQMNFTLYADCVGCQGDPCWTTYCNPGDGHPGNLATISASSCSLGLAITVDAAGVPVGQNGYLIVGDGTGIVVNPSPTNTGSLCVVGGTCIGRYVGDVQNSGGAGTYSTDVSDSNTAGPGFALPPACTGSIGSGEIWNFQYWHRLPGGGDTFSGAISIPFVN